MRLDLREFMLHVVGVHGLDLLPRWRPKHLDNLNQLVNAALAGEQRLTQHQFRHNTTS
jgi:hypothetical protein